MSITSIATDTIAARRARQNLGNNTRAFKIAAPTLDGLQWVLGRDGSLTCFDAEGRWHNGCSVPSGAARQMLRNYELSGAVACLLAPFHAAAIRVGLHRLKAGQALIVVIPCDRDWQVALGCEDFSKDVDEHRLFVVHGDSWSDQLHALLIANPGLNIPAQFIRLPFVTEEIDPMIAAAQAVFSEITEGRAQDLASIRKCFKRTEKAICAVGPSGFRLWNDTGAILKDVFENFVDTDDPRCASPLHLANCAMQAGALLTVDTSRADAPGVMPADLPWFTWVCNGRIPGFAGAGPNDRLLLADPEDQSRARSTMWPADRIHVALIPELEILGDCGSSVSLICDMKPLTPPKDVDEFSSHRLLWELVADELSRDPFAVGADPESYVRQRMHRFGITEKTLAVGGFISALVVPAYQQGIARILIDSKMPLKIFGRGWDQVERLEPHSGGPIETREQFVKAVASSKVLINPMPFKPQPYLMAVARPILGPFKSKADFLENARQGVAGMADKPERKASPLSARLIQEFRC